MIWKILQIGAPQKMGYCIKVQCCRNEKPKKIFTRKTKIGEEKNIKEAAAAAEERRVDFSPFSSRVQLDAEDHKTCGVYCGLVLWTTDQTKKTKKKDR